MAQQLIHPLGFKGLALLEYQVVIFMQPLDIFNPLL